MFPHLMRVLVNCFIFEIHTNHILFLQTYNNLFNKQIFIELFTQFIGKFYSFV